MQSHDLSAWTHKHSFDTGNPGAERGTQAVMWITLAMMVIEIVAGYAFNSMALLADGWHMSSHALAIGLSAFAYAAARRHADDPRFAFGTWKIEILGGYTSAILLLGVAALMLVGSVERIITPQAIHYREALAIAVVGLVVNVVCALILGRAQDHHEHDHGHAPHHAGGHGHQHHDLNLRSAYLHVLADAATSLLAIAALIGGLYYGWSWLDPVMGIVGAVLVASWARKLLLETGKVLLDREMDHPVVAEIREAVETGAESGVTRIADLHVWRVGTTSYACALSLVTHDPSLTAQRVRQQLAVHEEVVHVTVEIHQCDMEHAAAP
ncbi:MAG: CDF family Co(II)/Ni(II) efflux transporter DmeF [Rhodocyclales bacterium]|nr:CDF family Co(II)/Ni(II) efflux transporter DmeF [Rhodocyclales bacterium]